MLNLKNIFKTRLKEESKPVDQKPNKVLTNFRQNPSNSMPNPFKDSGIHPAKNIKAKPFFNPNIPEPEKGIAQVLIEAPADEALILIGKGVGVLGFVPALAFAIAGNPIGVGIFLASAGLMGVGQGIKLFKNLFI